MKRIEIKAIFDFISGIKISKVTKEVRSVIVSNYIAFGKVVKELERDKEDLKDYFLNEFKDEIDLYKTYMSELNDSSTDNISKLKLIEAIKRDCQGVLGLEEEIQEKLKELENSEVDITIAKIDRDTFLNVLADSGIDYSMSDIIMLEPLFLDA